MTRTITRKQAEQVLAAVRQQNISYLEPLVLPAHPADEHGPAEPETVYPPTCAEPVLVDDYAGHGPAVLWEEGPDDWAHRVVEGGRTETERIMLADARAEFGAPDTAPTGPGPVPARIPRGVHVEPISSWSLGIYPD